MPVALPPMLTEGFRDFPQPLKLNMRLVFCPGINRLISRMYSVGCKTTST
jgi:hypothetical protein